MNSILNRQLLLHMIIKRSHILNRIKYVTSLIATSQYNHTQVRIDNRTYSRAGNSKRPTIQNKMTKSTNKPAVNAAVNGTIMPFDIKPNLELPDQEVGNVGEQLVGPLNQYEVQKILELFNTNKKVRLLSKESGINDQMFQDAFTSFKRYCLKSSYLPTELHVKLSDLIEQKVPVTELFPFFLQHSQNVYPHLTCMEDLKKIGDLTEPANWFPEARKITRKVIYHGGPTNSGKTYYALQELKKSKTGIYCCPLKLLANEIAIKINEEKPVCDIITGDYKEFVNKDNSPSTHISCTIEMAALNREYEVAVIDEVQMIADSQRGWAWTRAFLGLCAKEIHICGDKSAVNLIEALCDVTGDTFELKTYERFSPLTFTESLNCFSRVRPGDCIVCFNRNDIFVTASQLQKLGHDVAVIYGAMPSAIRRAEAKRFNDPNNPCKILVATDAIGMGLNLNIGRIIFKRIDKPRQKDTQKDVDENINGDDLVYECITTSQALQIAGRAGRYGSQYPDGKVTTFYSDDAPVLKKILDQSVEPLVKAGLHPTIDQIELFAYHLPKHSFSNLLKIFLHVSQLDNSKYFMCDFQIMQYLASLIDHIPLKLLERYRFVSAPVDIRQTALCSCFVKFVRSHSRDEQFTLDDIKKLIEWPLKEPSTVEQLAKIEVFCDTLDLYLWLAQRFSQTFIDGEQVRQFKHEIDELINKGIKKIVKTFRKAYAEAYKTEQLKIAEIKEVKKEKKNTKDQLETIDKKATNAAILAIFENNDENEQLKISETIEVNEEKKKAKNQVETTEKELVNSDVLAIFQKNDRDLEALEPTILPQLQQSIGKKKSVIVSEIRQSLFESKASNFIGTKLVSKNTSFIQDIFSGRKSKQSEQLIKLFSKQLNEIQEASAQLDIIKEENDINKKASIDTAVVDVESDENRPVKKLPEVDIERVKQSDPRDCLQLIDELLRSGVVQKDTAARLVAELRLKVALVDVEVKPPSGTDKNNV